MKETLTPELASMVWGSAAKKGYTPSDITSMAQKFHDCVHPDPSELTPAELAAYADGWRPGGGYLNKRSLK